MTCIVGLVEDGKVYMGGDSAGTGGGYNQTIRRDPKVFRVGPYLIGYTSSFRMGQLLRFSLTVPDQDPRHDDERHMMTTFIEAVRSCLKDGGFATVSSNSESGGTFLVGYKGVLYEIGDDYQVGISECQYDAVGCGYQLALGAMYATSGKKPKERLQAALQAAEEFNAGVRGPFRFEELEP